MLAVGIGAIGDVWNRNAVVSKIETQKSGTKTHKARRYGKQNTMSKCSNILERCINVRFDVVV
jgi:hypothetical protein